MIRLSAGIQRLLNDPRGLPPASAVATALGQALAIASAIWLLSVGVWEIDAAFGPGREQISSAITLAGENMLRWGTALPVLEPRLAPPTTEHVDLEHPFGVYWLSALVRALFGHHDWVCRLPAVLLTASSPVLLYGLGRALYGPLAGGLAALSFALTPITLALCQVTGFEVPLTFAALLASLGYVRLRQTARRGWGLISLVGLVACLNCDWPGFGFAFTLLAIAFVRVFVMRPPRRDFEAGARWFAWGATLTALTAAYYAIVFVQAGKLPSVFAPEPALALKKAADPALMMLERRQLVLSSFTSLVPYLTAVFAGMMFVRALLRRRDEELVPLAAFVLGALQLNWFGGRPSAAVLPHAFGALFALALGFGFDLLDRNLSKTLARTSLVLRVCGFALIPALLTPDAVRLLWSVRKIGLEASASATPEIPEHDKLAALAALSRRLSPDAAVVVDPNVRPGPWLSWTLDQPVRSRDSDWSRDRDRYFVIDGRFASSSELHELSRRSAMFPMGPLFLFDRAKPAAPVSAFAIERREPTAFERLFVSSTHAQRELVADPFATYEIREHLAQAPNPQPTLVPRSFEQLRIAHNAAIARGDMANALALRRRLLDGIDRRPETEYRDGTRLLGLRIESGVSQILTLYFESQGPAEQRFVVTSELVAAPLASFVPWPRKVREIGVPSYPTRDSWRPGYLYSVVVELPARPGRERLAGSWIATIADVPLVAKSGARDVTLLVLP